jgi:hypothetical protein
MNKEIQLPFNSFHIDIVGVLMAGGEVHLKMDYTFVNLINSMVPGSTNKGLN